MFMLRGIDKKDSDLPSEEGTFVAATPSVAPSTLTNDTSSDFQGCRTIRFNETSTVVFVHREEDYFRGKPNDYQRWGSRFEFFLACLGYRVDHLNILRFPVFIYNNGGIKCLLPCLLSILVFGIPFHLIEAGLGQFSAFGPIQIWNLCPLYKGIGVAMLVFQIIVAIHNSCLVSMEMAYFIMSMKGTPYWRDCNNSWNSDNCTTDYDSTTSFTTDSSVEFFQFITSEHAAIALCHCFLWTATCMILQGRTKRLGKMTNVFTLFPYLSLFVLVATAFELDTYSQGMIKFLFPAKSPSLIKTWVLSALNTYTLLGCSTGTVLSFSCYNNFDSPLLLHTVLTPLIKVVSSFCLGCFVFCSLCHACKKWKIPISSFAIGDQLFVLNIYPSVLSVLPRPYITTTVFFSVLFWFGLSTQFLSVKCVVVILEQEFTEFTKIIPMFCCFLGFVISSLLARDMYPVHSREIHVTDLAMVVIGLHFSIVITWIYGANTVIEDIGFIMGLTRLKFVLSIIVWTMALPVPVWLCVVVFDQVINFDTTHWICFSSFILFVELYVIYKIIRVFVEKIRKGTDDRTAIQVLRDLLAPSPEWDLKRLPFMKDNFIPQTSFNSILVAVPTKLNRPLSRTNFYNENKSTPSRRQILLAN